ncbi:hypothetical protein Tco_0855326 [Tanacetum coccineum]
MAYTSNSSGSDTEDWMIMFYRPTANKTSASVSQVEASTSQTSNTSVEMLEVESVSGLNESIKPKQAKKPRMITQNPKVDRRDWNGHMTQKLGLGFGFTKKACFVCGSYSHLIKECDFHEKRMAKKSVLKNIGKNTGQREIRPVWNNTQRINHQNKFVPSAVLTRSRRVPVSAAKQSSFRAAASTGAGTKTSLLTIKTLMEVLLILVEVLEVKNSVLFTETECLVLSPDFKLLDESQVLLRVPRQSNMYSFDLKNIVPSGDLTCLFAKAIIDESKLWHRFSWVFFLASKDETSRILKRFITEIEN